MEDSSRNHGFAALLLTRWEVQWLERRTLMPALIVRAVTLVAPFFVMQPARGRRHRRIENAASKRCPTAQHRHPYYVRYRLIRVRVSLGPADELMLAKQRPRRASGCEPPPIPLSNTTLCAP